MSKVLLDSIMENCQDIITVKNLNGYYLACNKAFLDILNFKNDTEVINKHVSEIMSSRNGKLILSNMKAVLDTGRPQTYTFRIINEKINKVYTQILTPIIENGVITKILSVSRDVTEEESLKHKLVEKVTQLNTLLAHIPMLVYMKDTDGKYITGSKHAKQFVETGLDPYAGNVQIDNDYNSPIVEEEDNYVLSSKLMLIKEQKTKSVEGNDLWYKIYKAPILDVSNKVNGIVTIAQNIDAEKRLEAQKELFLATLTHDLKNPVQAQLMSMKMLRNEAFGSLNDEQKEMLDMIIESSVYMQDMLYSILKTYKYDNGVIELEKANFDVDSLMNSCINEVKALAKDKNITIVYRSTLEGKKLLADANQLRRVVANIINNAVNYAYSDSELGIDVYEKGDNVVFDFANISDPIPEDMKGCIFDKYVTGAYQKVGIGLGLYFSKRVVEAHNGKIYLTADGNHNIFSFELPLIDSDVKASVVW